MLFNNTNRPRLIGKNDESGMPLVSSEGELSPNDIALVIGQRLLNLEKDLSIETRISDITTFYGFSKKFR